MDTIFKITALGIALSGFLVLLKKNRPEQAFLIVVALGVFVFGIVADFLGTINDFTDTLADAASLSPAFLSPLFKIVGIGLVSGFGAQICKDAGENALASFIETAATVISVYLALPLMKAVLKMINDFV